MKLIIPFLLLTATVNGQYIDKNGTTITGGKIEPLQIYSRFKRIDSALRPAPYDTIPRILMISDTPNRFDTERAERYAWQLEGYVVYKVNVYGEAIKFIGYLNDRKKPLPKKWAVWTVLR